MYSRNGDRRIPPGFSIPDNYGGNTFSPRGGENAGDRQSSSEERRGTACEQRCNSSQCRDRREPQRGECRDSPCEEQRDAWSQERCETDCREQRESRREECCDSKCCANCCAGGDHVREREDSDQGCRRSGCNPEDSSGHRQSDRCDEGCKEKNCSSPSACRDGFMSISIGAEELLLLGVMALVFFSGGKRDDELLICLLLVLLI